MNIFYYLAPDVSKKTGEQRIRAAITVNKTRYISTVGMTIKADDWNQETQSAVAKSVNEKGIKGSAINDRLSTIRKHFEEYEKELTHKPTTDEIKRELENAINGVIPVKKSKNVLTYFDRFIKEESIDCQWTTGTMEQWNAFRKHLEAQGKGIQFDHFNNEGINAFVRYLRTTCKMGENTVQKHYLNLKWFLGWAVRNGYAKDSEIGKVQPKFKIIDKPVIFLTKDELMRLYKYEVPVNGTKVKLHNYEGEEYEKEVHDKAALEKTRDLFCFCAFTSLRYSDMANLKRSDVIGDCIYITTQKTNDRIPIDLNSFSKAILNKYKKEKFPKGLALPVISNQRMNDYLKDICELCEINEPITRVNVRAGQRVEETRPKYELVGTHAGRRTFICFALASGIPPQVVMKWTGHSDYKAMKPYIDIAEKVRSENMAIFEKGLEK